MATLLHDHDVLRSLADSGSGPGTDWARTRLALYAPDAPVRLPDDPGLTELILARRPQGTVDALGEAVRAKPDDVPLASAVWSLGTYGSLPEDSTSLAASVRHALQSASGPAVGWHALTLATLDASSPRDLARVADIHHEDTTWILPALVLQAAGDDADSIAEEVVSELEARAQLTGPVVASLEEALGLPVQFTLRGVDEAGTAAALGAGMASASLTLRVQPRGSRKRRAQRWVLALLEGMQHPAASWLRAFTRDGRAGDLAPYAVAQAAWLRHFSPGDDPVDNVIRRNAAHLPRVLSAARRAVSDDDVDALVATLERGHRGAAPLAIPLLSGDRGEELARVLLRSAVQAQVLDIRSDTLAATAAAAHPDLVPPLLEERSTRLIGLLVAEWTPTLEVLEALLSLPMPADKADRVQFARTLAAMGDQAALPALKDVLETEEEDEHRWARALAEDLLRTSL